MEWDDFTSGNMIGLIAITGGIVLLLGQLLLNKDKPRRPFPYQWSYEDQKGRMIGMGIMSILFGLIIIAINC